LNWAQAASLRQRGDVEEMKELLKKMDDNGITWSYGKTYCGTSKT